MWRWWQFDPPMMRRAKAIAHQIENTSIFITDHAQLVGYMGSLPHTLAWRVDGATIVNEELYNEPNIMPEPEEESLKKVAELNSYWAGQTAVDKLARILDPEDAVKFLSGAIGWGAPTSAYGYSGKDYEYIFASRRGFLDIIEEIDQHIEEAEDKTIGVPGPDILPLYDRLQNWDAMKLILQASINYAKRYARLARIIAENFETDPVRKEELLRLAETCENVPAKAPQNLQESLQYDHFIQMLARTEAHEGAWPARPDYYHWPMYEKDVLIDKRITRDEALDLIGEFLIRAYEVGGFGPRWAREGLQGITGTWVWTLGGVNKDGSDACNDLTVAFLQAARLVRVANPTFGFRWHPKVKDEVIREVFECIRHGLGVSLHPERPSSHPERHALARPSPGGSPHLGASGLHEPVPHHQAWRPAPCAWRPQPPTAPRWWSTRSTTASTTLSRCRWVPKPGMPGSSGISKSSSPPGPGRWNGSWPPWSAP